MRSGGGASAGNSLTFQSPNWNLQLPGFALRTHDADAFAPRDDVVRFIESYAAFIRVPLRSGLAVDTLCRKPGSARLVIETAAGSIEANDVVIATGPYQTPIDPLPIARTTLHLHSSRYRNPESRTDVYLVVGTGNSGCQIAEELCSAGRRVYLSVSNIDAARDVIAAKTMCGGKSSWARPTRPSHSVNPNSRRGWLPG